MDKSNIPLAELIQYSDTYNRSEGKSPRTVHWYHEVLNMLLDWLMETGHPATLGAVGENDVRAVMNIHANDEGNLQLIVGSDPLLLFVKHEELTHRIYDGRLIPLGLGQRDRGADRMDIELLPLAR